jgi:hypothetical protein
MYLASRGQADLVRSQGRQLKSGYENKGVAVCAVPYPRGKVALAV